MADSVTTNYALKLPEPHVNASTWAEGLNGNMGVIDAQMFANQKAGVPIGAISMYAGFSRAPTNWLFCNGAALDRTVYAALFAVCGYSFGGSGANFNLPNLTNRFPLGNANTGAAGAVGGEASHALTAAETAAHSHPIVDASHSHVVSQSPHNHGLSDPGHVHAASQDAHFHSGVMQTGIDPYYTFTGANWFGPGHTDTKQPNVYIGGAVTGIGIAAANANIALVAAKTGITTTAAAGGGAAHNNMPPYLAINFIIRFQ